jgi:hypothetical protein|tara:strand:- start:5882 stop:6358 length:477 start_codon:yes stop_codon:yes gene_type:complete
MLEVRPLVVADGVVVGGNMRLRALQDLGYKEVPVIDVTEWTQAQRDEFMIKDNVSFGDWDWDVLANEWEVDQLKDWGLYVPKWDTTEFNSEIEDTGEYDYPEEVHTQAGVRMVQLFLDTTTEPNIKEWELALRESYGTDNLTDTIYQAVKEAYYNKYG